MSGHVHTSWDIVACFLTLLSTTVALMLTMLTSGGETPTARWNTIGEIPTFLGPIP